jgi:hypothetical protein
MACFDILLLTATCVRAKADPHHDHVFGERAGVWYLLFVILPCQCPMNLEIEE